MSATPGHGEKLTRKQEQALAALLVCPTILEAATRCGVHFQTLRAWLAKPAFARAYETARKELLARTIERLQHAVFATVDALIADLGHADPHVRHKAAEMLLETAVKGTECLQFGQQVTDAELRATGKARTNGVAPRIGLRELA